MAYFGYNPCDFDPALSERRALQAEAAWEYDFQRRWENARAYLIQMGVGSPSDDEIEDAMSAAEDADFETREWADEVERLS